MFICEYNACVSTLLHANDTCDFFSFSDLETSVALSYSWLTKGGGKKKIKNYIVQKENHQYLISTHSSMACMFITKLGTVCTSIIAISSSIGSAYLLSV